jgi:hypothetical protein
LTFPCRGTANVLDPFFDGQSRLVAQL